VNPSVLLAGAKKGFQPEKLCTKFPCYIWGTSVKRAMRGLVTLPLRCIQEPLVVRDRDGRHPRGPQAVHCICVCSGERIGLGLLGGSISEKRDSLSVLSIYHRTFLSLLFVSSGGTVTVAKPKTASFQIP